MLAQWTIKWLKSVKPEVRLEWAARFFWWSILLGVISIILISHGWFQKILMAISWLAITVTCADIVVTTDLKTEEGS